MNEPSFKELFTEYEITPQERCLSCPLLGNLALQLSAAHTEKKRMASFIDPATFAEIMRPGIVSYMVAENPNVTVEEIQEELQMRLNIHVEGGGEQYLLKSMGALHEHHDVQAEEVARQINTLLESCPPEGHTPATT